MKLLRILGFLATVLVALAVSAAPHVRVSGVWQEVDEIHVKVSGTWQEVDEGWVRVSGVWQQFYDAVTLSMKTETYYSLDATTTITLQTNGDVSVVSGSGTPDVGDWIEGNPITNVGNDWEVYATLVSGSVSSGTTGSWLALSSPRTWGRTRPAGVGINQAVLTFAFRPAGGGSTVYTSGNVTLQAEEDGP